VHVFGTASTVFNTTDEVFCPQYIITEPSQYIKNGMALAMVVLMMIVLLFLKNHGYNLYRIIVNYRFAKKQYEETSSIPATGMLFMKIFTLLIVSIYFSLLLDLPEKYMITVPFAIFTAVFFAQNIFMRLTGFLCKTEEISGEIIFNRKYFFNIIGITVFPALLLSILYDSQQNRLFLSISGILLAITLATMQIRLMSVFTEAKVSYFFRFLYLCALEISPYFLLLIIFEYIG
jgi:hypothetical protein